MDLANKRAILIALSATLALPTSAALAATLSGDGSDNELFGTSSSDTVKGYGGNDLIYGYGAATTSMAAQTATG